MNPFDFTPALVDDIFAPLLTVMDEVQLTTHINQQLKEARHTRYIDQVHIVIMRTLWDEMLDKGSQLLPKDVRMLADKLADELEKI